MLHMLSSKNYILFGSIMRLLTLLLLNSIVQSQEISNLNTNFNFLTHNITSTSSISYSPLHTVSSSTVDSRVTSVSRITKTLLSFPTYVKSPLPAKQKGKSETIEPSDSYYGFPIFNLFIIVLASIGTYYYCKRKRRSQNYEMLPLWSIQ